jgi:hypothetical protein
VSGKALVTPQFDLVIGEKLSGNEDISREDPEKLL